MGSICEQMCILSHSQERMFVFVFYPTLISRYRISDATSGKAVHKKSTTHRCIVDSIYNLAERTLPVRAESCRHGDYYITGLL